MIWPWPARTGEREREIYIYRERERPPIPKLGSLQDSAVGLTRGCPVYGAKDCADEGGSKAPDDGPELLPRSDPSPENPLQPASGKSQPLPPSIETHSLQPSPAPHTTGPTQQPGLDESAQKQAATSDLPQQTEEQVVTRRKQFKTKRDKKEGKHAQKLAKAAEKEEKKRLKEQQRQDKQEKKEQEKELRKQKKARQEEKGQEKNKQQQNKRKAMSQPENALKAKVSKSKKTSLKPASNKVKRNRKGSKAQECSISKSTCHAETGVNADATADATDVLGTESVECTTTVARLPCSPDKQRLKPAKHNKLRSLQHALSERKAKKASQAQRKGKMSIQQAGSSAASTAEHKKAPVQRKRKARAELKRKEPQKHSNVSPKDEYVTLVTNVLTECHESHCTHPAWEPPHYDKKVIQLSVYWTRTAVGVKVPKPAASKSKGKKASKMSQVAYFACETSCVYTNMAIARVFVFASVTQSLHMAYIVSVEVAVTAT